jgi:murein DD-endopeptidase MepM/ murein hydrolase activator NlpD
MDALTTRIVRMGQAPRRADRFRAGVELGHEPAIVLGEPRADGRDRWRVPSRWMLGGALTGLSGLALLGSALYLDLDRQSTFAQPPQLASAHRKDGPDTESVNSGKGDRLVRPVDIVAAKQSYRLTMPIKIGDKEVLKTRPFTLLSTSLPSSPTEFAEAVPPFDPLKATNGSAEKGDAPAEAAPSREDSEVAFASRDITAADVVSISGELSLQEAEAQVVETIKARTAGDRRPALPPQMLLTRTSRAGVDPLGALAYAATGSVDSNTPFSSIEVRMVPENVTNVAKSPYDGRLESRERLARPKRGETLEDVLRANGADVTAIAGIMAAFAGKRGDSVVEEGQKIILRFDEPSALGERPPIARVSIYADDQLKSAVAMRDDSSYVPVMTPRRDDTPRRGKRDTRDEGGISLYQSLYQTALKQGFVKPVIDEMVRAFANDVDFQRGVQPGDALVAFASEADEIDPKSELLFATLTAGDQTFKYYRFQTPDDNLIDYYDENGRSTRKFLIRKPISEGEMTSSFGMRYHPILHFAKMHTGIDWAAPVGTPILAAGNGVVIKAEFTEGYGRRVELQHANGYVTTYNHMSGFGRGIVAGVRVTQGQVVGFLGQSGLATGPHLHYEVIINGNFVDPMAIKLARTREFDGKMLSLFKKERERIDGLMSQAPNAGAGAPGPTAKLN